MSFLSRFFGPKYDDEKLASLAKQAVEVDPLLATYPTLDVSCDHGVLTIAGTVHKAEEKDHIEGVVRSAIRNVGLTFEGIDNRLKLV